MWRGAVCLIGAPVFIKGAATSPRKWWPANKEPLPPHCLRTGCLCFTKAGASPWLALRTSWSCWWLSCVHWCRCERWRLPFQRGLLLLLFSHLAVSDSATPQTAAHQAPLSFTISQSLLKLTSIESVMPSNHLILCRPLLFLPSVFPRIRVFLMCQLFASGGQTTGASASVLLMDVLCKSLCMSNPM